jgi:SAM-dependent methyltransferase
MSDAAVLQRSDRVAACPEIGQVTVLRDSWDAHAAEWIAWVRSPDEPDSYFRFHREHFLSLVPEPGGLTVDIGCGEGRVGRDLEQRGHRVLGIDWSFTMCKAAATHPHAPAHVAVGDAAKLPLADSSVDCVTAFMCLQDIDDMPGAISEMARVLDDGRRLALAIVHPMYSGGKFSQTGTADKDFVVKRSYFKPELCVSEDGHDGLKVLFFREHRPLEAYVRALLDAGFIIEQLHEVTDEDESKPWHRVPMFLDILATRKLREAKIEPSHLRERILVSLISGLSIAAAAAAWLALMWR